MIRIKGNIIKILVYSTVIFAVQLSFFHPVVNSNSTLEKALEEKSSQKSAKEAALNKTKSEIAAITSSKLSLDGKISALEEKIGQINADISASESEVDESEKALAEQAKLLEERVSKMRVSSTSLYKESRNSLLGLILSKDNGSDALRSYFFQKYSLEIRSNEAKSLAAEIAQMKAKQDELLELKSTLVGQKEALETSKAEFDAEKAKIQSEMAKQYESQRALQAQINQIDAEISTLQAAVLAAKSAASQTISSGGEGTGSGGASNSDFMANAPYGSFGVFSYGAYTHRKGMSQYGARARADAGQNFSQILQAYYGQTPAPVDTTGNIAVQGHGEMDFETTYLYGIAEMPSSWSLEAQKAQAVAARTYAQRYRVQGSAICITEACQVWNPSKSANPPALWKQAVDETRGYTLDGVVTFYSSTSGGYVSPLGWDTVDGRGVTNPSWATQAWEFKANSPWFYRAWYRLGYTDQGANCGRQAWLSEAEMADILNAWIVLNQNGGAPGVDTSRIIPVTINQCPIGASGGNPYSVDQLRSMTVSPVLSISGPPAVIQANNGTTTSVIFDTNRGILTVPGTEFKAMLNLRAPGYISIPQSGFTFINVERKL